MIAAFGGFPRLRSQSQLWRSVQVRGIKLFEVFSREKTAERKKRLKVHSPDGRECSFPSSSGPAASLVCLAFRSGAEESLTSWRHPFQQHWQPQGQHAHVCLYELALIDSQVMSMWPFRQLILSGGSRQQSAASTSAPDALPLTALWYFGDVQPVIRAIGCTNKLSGYAYLLDEKGRIRWRASGHAQPDELQSMLTASEELVYSHSKV